MIETFTEYLAGKGLNDETIKNYLRIYKKFDKGLEKKELNQSYINKFMINNQNPNHRAFLGNLFDCFDINLKVPKHTGSVEKKERRSITTKELELFRKWIHSNKDERYLLCLDLSYTCALRRAELFAIHFSDFEFEKWVENPSESCKLLIHGKRKRERYVPVQSKLMYRIVDYVEKTKKLPEDRLFAFAYKQWDKSFKQAVKSQVNYNFTLHDLRRSRATQWLLNGIDIMRVKNRLGHSSISTTQLYINLEKEKEFSDWANE